MVVQCHVYRLHLIALGDDHLRPPSEAAYAVAVVRPRANHGGAGVRELCSLHDHRRRCADLKYLTRLDAGRDRDKHRPVRRVRLELTALGDAIRDRHVEHIAISGGAARTSRAHRERTIVLC